MGVRDATGLEKTVIVLNGVIRFAQFVVAVACLGLYGTEKACWGFELAIGSMALITAVAFGAIPFFMSYRPVALGTPWDAILMILWGAAFSLMKAIFLRTYSEDDNNVFHHTGPDDIVDERHHWNTMRNGAYVNLAGFILFLIGAVMGAVLFYIGRRSGSSRATYA